MHSAMGRGSSEYFETYSEFEHHNTLLKVWRCSLNINIGEITGEKARGV